MLGIFRKTALSITSYLSPALGLAADISGKSTQLAGAASPLSISYVLQIITSFIAVILFILVIAWLMKKSGRFGASSNKAINIVSSMSLGMREKIVVVNVEDVNIVLGVAPGQIRTLYVLDNAPAAEETADVKEGGAFEKVMGNLLKK